MPDFKANLEPLRCENVAEGRRKNSIEKSFDKLSVFLSTQFHLTLHSLLKALQLGKCSKKLGKPWW